MNKLRTLAITTLMLVVLVAIAGILFAYYKMWSVAISLLLGAVVLSVLTTLLTTRYIAHNARTGEQRTKVVTQQLSAGVKEAMHQHERATAELGTLVESLQKRHDESDRLTRDLQSELKTKIAEVDATVAKVSKNNADQANGIKKHTTSTVRDSSRQIESLVHIYQRYPEVKLPMPSTGGWAIDSQALAHMLALIEERQPQRILELGSGTSTIWAGYLCQKFGGRIVTLDHLEHYLNLTRTAIDRHQLDDVIESRLAPLNPTDCRGKTFNWYSMEGLQDLQDIDMVIIDGPPAATGPQARYPALPKVWEFLAPNATIILDDAHRQDEAKIVEAWLSEYPDFEEIEHGTSRLAVLQRHVS